MSHLRLPGRAMMAGMLTILLTSLAFSVGFIQNPTINQGATVYTTDDLVCHWNATEDTTEANISWHRNGLLNVTRDVSGQNNDTLSSASTTKTDVWSCNITLSNGTETVTQGTSVTIQNSRPDTETPPAGIFSGLGVDVGYFIQIDEDETLLLDVNATDADGDSLTYSLPDHGGANPFCTRLSSVLGTYSCGPTHNDIRLANESEQVTVVNVTFIVLDGQNPGGRSIIFNITPVNDAPEITIPDQVVNVTAVFNRSFTGSDEEHDYPFTAMLDEAITDPQIKDDVNVSVEGNTTIRILYSTSPIDYSDVGNRTIAFTLFDTRGENTSINFTLEILGVNRQPYFTNISPPNWSSPTQYRYVLLQGESILIDLGANDPDTADRVETITFSDNSSRFTTTTANSTATNESDARGYLNFTAQNADVGNHSVTLIVTDAQGATNTTIFDFTIINVNDPPVIHNESNDSSNSGGNVDINDLIAYLNAPFRYQVNFSDLDLDLDLDVLSWSDNATLFNITNDGRILFTPSGIARNETVNLTVTDQAGLSDTRIVTIEVRENSPPYFNETLPPLACNEGQPCIFNLSHYAKDDDLGDAVDTYQANITSGTLASFALNTVTGMINFTPLQTEIGNSSFTITITDTRGASAVTQLNISVMNAEDYPVWTRYDFSAETIVETHEFNYRLWATDQDLLVDGSTELLAFTSNISWFTITIEQTTNETVFALLSFTPDASRVGTHVVQLNVTDATGRINSTTVTFTVRPKTNPPLIEYLRPYGNDASAHALVRGWLDVQSLSPPELVSLTENTSDVVFEVNATDDDAVGPPYPWLNYTWFYDGILVQGPSSSKSYTRSFGFFSSGNVTLEAVVNDTSLESASWTWSLTITDVNRPPVLQENFTGAKENITISDQNTIADYFVYNVAGGGFYDPDDDPDSNPSLFITSGYALELSYDWTLCSVANLSQSNNSLTVKPVAVGSCIVQFTATDSGGLSATSNLVTITVTQVPQGSQAISVSSGGGGGGVTTRNTFVPLRQEVQTPKPLTIIAPKLVTIYQNRTITVPITLKNNWTEPFEGILLGAETLASDVVLRFDSDYLEALAVGESLDVMLTVEGYRLGENFEVAVTANVSDPNFQDTALILFNSIEQSQEGKDVAIKVTFAQDLLSQNRECQELNEYLQQADAQLKQGDVEAAGRIVDFVINGCKYLISRTQPETRRPGVFRTPFVEIDDETVRILAYLALGAAVIIAVVGLAFYYHRTKERFDF